MLPLKLDPYKFEFNKENKWLVPIGIGNRHVHLSQNDIDKLFGQGYQLTVAKELSQIGQFAAKETVNVVGAKGVLEKVRIVGPARPETQVELCRTDCVKIGVEPVIRDSGELDDTPGVVLIGPKGPQIIDKGCIVPRAHIHLDPKTAGLLELYDKDKVSVLIRGSKVVCYHDVLVRVSKTATTEFHIDTDEANAGFVDNGDLAMIKHREMVVKDAYGNIVEVGVDNVKFIQAKKVNEYATKEGLNLISDVFQLPKLNCNTIVENLLNPDRIAPNEFYFLTAMKDDKVIGVATFYYLAELKMGYLENIRIIPEYCSRGIGTFFYHKIIYFLEKEHPEIEGILLGVKNNGQDMESRKTFFLNLGVIPVDTAFYPQDKFSFADGLLLMFKPLVVEASLNTRTLEKAFHDLSQVL